jgi:DNA-directed RNA polymerase beta' subunit
MNIAHSVPSTVTSVSFSFLTSEDIRRISVKQIKNSGVLEYGRPVYDGLYDPALGPSDRSDMYVDLIFFSAFVFTACSCATCHLTYFTCPGHYGHVDLPSTVFHPLFMGNMYNLLRGVCMFCHRFKITRVQVSKLSL